MPFISFPKISNRYLFSCVLLLLFLLLLNVTYICNINLTVPKKKNIFKWLKTSDQKNMNCIYLCINTSFVADHQHEFEIHLL